MEQEQGTGDEDGEVDTRKYMRKRRSYPINRERRQGIRRGGCGKGQKEDRPDEQGKEEEGDEDEPDLRSKGRREGRRTGE